MEIQQSAPLPENGEQKAEKLRFSKKEEALTQVDILQKVSSGTALREGLDEIVNGGKGALIVFHNPEAEKVFSGGFKVNCKLTPKRLFELAKMDGAIIVSGDLKRILYANTLLVPDMKYGSDETGIRHQSAERTAKQIKGLVVTVSERRHKVTLYYGHSKYVLRSTGELLRRATETLQIVEKQKEALNELLSHLDVLEIAGLATVEDVSSILQRLASILKMTTVMERYLIELGDEGIIIAMRIREIMASVETIKQSIILDYVPRPKRAEIFFTDLRFSDFARLDAIAHHFFKKSLEADLVPKGHRLLGKTELDKSKVGKLVKRFKNLKRILYADEVELKKVLKKDSDFFMREIQELREHIMVGQRG